MIQLILPLYLVCSKSRCYIIKTQALHLAGSLYATLLQAFEVQWSATPVSWFEAKLCDCPLFIWGGSAIHPLTHCPHVFAALITVFHSLKLCFVIH